MENVWEIILRGLRQDDPLSPYLFLLCKEWFSSQLNHLQNLKKVEDIKIARGISRMNLFFADDSLLFVKALEHLHEMKRLLNRYEKMAGQKVNYDKYKFLIPTLMSITWVYWQISSE